MPFLLTLIESRSDFSHSDHDNRKGNFDPSSSVQLWWMSLNLALGCVWIISTVKVRPMFSSEPISVLPTKSATGSANPRNSALATVAVDYPSYKKVSRNPRYRQVPMDWGTCLAEITYSFLVIKKAKLI